MQPTFSFSDESTSPEELREQTPRRVSLTGHGIQMAIAGALLLALAAAGAVWVGMNAEQLNRRNAELHSNSRVAEGYITQRLSSDTFPSRVSYAFTADGKTYTGEIHVSEPVARDLAGSKSLRILYLPSNPTINHPIAWHASPRSEMVLLVAPVISALLGFLLFVPLFVERRLAAEGTPALAMVTKCARGRHGFLIHYAFHLAGGKAVKGRGWYDTWQEPGASVWALYLPQNPRRNLPYPLSYCRVL